MATARKLGFEKGSFVFTGMFPGIVIGDVHTTTPLCEVWGVEQELGSAPADDLRRLSKEEFVAMAKPYGFNGTAYSKEAQKALAAV